MKAQHVRNGISLCRWLGLLALAAFSLNVFAFGADRHADFEWSTDGNTSKAVPTSNPSAGSPTYRPSAGGPTVGRDKHLPWPGKAQAEHMAKWKAMASPNNMAKSIMRPGIILPLVAGGIWDFLIEQACVRMAGGVMQLSDTGAWEECNFTEQTITATRRYYNSYASVYGGTAQEACGGYVAGGHAGGVQYSFSCYSGSTPVQGGYEVWQCLNGTTWSSAGNVNDANNNNPPSCGTGLARDPNQPWKPTSDGTAETKLTDKLTDWSQSDMSANPDNDLGNTPRVLKDLLDGGVKVEMQPQPVTGPATVPGNPVTSTKTNADGSTTTITITTTNKYTYAGDTVTRNVVTQTTNVTNNIDNSTTTTTETTEEDDERTECEMNPDAFGCKDLDVPEGEVPRKTETVSWAPESLGFGGGSCPAGPSWSDSLGSHSLNLQPYCDKVVSVVRPVVLAIAALMAYFIVAGIKSED